MASPFAELLLGGGLIMVGVVHTNWQASAVEDPLLLLPAEAAWNFGGTVADPRSSQS